MGLLLLEHLIKQGRMRHKDKFKNNKRHASQGIEGIGCWNCANKSRLKRELQMKISEQNDIYIYI